MIKEEMFTAGEVIQENNKKDINVNVKLLLENMTTLEVLTIKGFLSQMMHAAISSIQQGV